MAGVDDELNPDEMQPPDDIPEFDESEELDFTGAEEPPLYEAPPDVAVTPTRNPLVTPERDPRQPIQQAPLGFEPDGGGVPVPKIPEAPPPVPPPPDDIPDLTEEEAADGLGFKGVEAPAPVPPPADDLPGIEEDRAVGQPPPETPPPVPPPPPDDLPGVDEDNTVDFQTMPESMMEPWQVPPSRRQKWSSRRQKAQAQRGARRQRMGLPQIDYGEDEDTEEFAQALGRGAGGFQQQQQEQGGFGDATQVLQEILAAIQETNEKLDEVVDKLDDVGTYGQ